MPGSVLIVPALRVGMPPRTLRVPPSLGNRIAGEATRSVTGCVPPQSVGTIRYTVGIHDRAVAYATAGLKWLYSRT